MKFLPGIKVIVSRRNVVKSELTVFIAVGDIVVHESVWIVGDQHRQTELNSFRLRIDDSPAERTAIGSENHMNRSVSSHIDACRGNVRIVFLDCSSISIRREAQ